jgi:hypothetical protein
MFNLINISNCESCFTIRDKIVEINSNTITIDVDTNVEGEDKADIL